MSSRRRNKKERIARESISAIAIISLTILSLLFIRDGLTGFVVKQVTIHSLHEQAWELDAQLEESVTRIRIENFTSLDYPLAAASYDGRDQLPAVASLDNRRATIHEGSSLFIAFVANITRGDTVALHLRHGDPGTISLCPSDALCAGEWGSFAYSGAEGWYNLTLLGNGSIFFLFFPDKVQVNQVSAYHINNSYDVENRSYPASASFETADLIVPDLLRWDTLIPEETLNSQAIGYSYSADSGQSWTSITDFNLSAVRNTTLRFRATLASDGSATPELDYLRLGYWTAQLEERDYTITPSLQYRSGTSFDRDNDGVENLTGVVDLQVGASFSWAVDTSTLCTRYWIQPAGNDSSFVCSGDASCCAFVDLAPGLPDWNDPLHIFVGRYGAGRNNTVRAQVLSVGAGEDIFSSGWVNRSAVFLPAAPACAPRWECAAYGPCVDRVKRCTSIADVHSCGSPAPVLPLPNASCMPYAAQVERSEDIAVYSFFNNDNASLRVQLQQGAAALDIRAGSVVNGTIAVANYTENVKEILHALPALGRYVDIVADPVTTAGVSSATLVVSYTDAEVAAAGLNESSLAIYYLDEDTEEWMTVDSAVNTTGNYVTAFLEHISFYGIFGTATASSGQEAGTSPPAVLQAQNISITPDVEHEVCTYDFTIDAPLVLSFVEQRSQDISIINTGCPIDTLGITIDDPLHLLTVRERSMTGIGKDEHVTVTLQANKTVPLRQEFPIQGFITESVQGYIQNYTVGLMISADGGGKSALVKEVALTAQLIAPASREPLTANRTAVILLLNIAVLGSAGAMYWYWKKYRPAAQP